MDSFVDTEAYSNPVLDLVLRFQAYNSEVFLGFSFDDPSFYEPINRKRSDVFLLGTYDTDGLAISLLNNEIIVLNHDNLYEEKLYDCSIDGFTFLDAIAIFREYQYQVLANAKSMLINDKEIARRYADRACLAAGGDKYIMFYLALFNCYTDDDIKKYSLWGNGG